MTVFFQAAALAVLVSITVFALTGREYQLLLILSCCCFILLAAISFLEPVLTFLRELEALSGLDSTMVSILLKALCIALITEFAGMICHDGGNGSMAKALHLLGTALILWLSIPIFQGLLQLIQSILGGI